MYEIGDTLLVRSADPDSNKGWIGVLNSTNQVGGIFVFGVQSLGQFFENGFSPGEEVTLAFQGGLDNSVPFNNFANYHNHLNDGYLYIVCAFVPGAYSSGLTQTLITADFPVDLTDSRAFCKAGWIS